jgi:hypothetical protein
MVISGDDLEVKLRQIGMRNGNIVVSIEIELCYVCSQPEPHFSHIQ